MTRTSLLAALVASLVIAPGDTAQSQGKGKENKPEKAQAGAAHKDHKAEKGQARAQGGKGEVQKADKPGRLDKPAVRGRSDKEKQTARSLDNRSRVKVVTEAGGEVKARNYRVWAASNKHGHRLAGRTVSAAMKRGLSDDDFVITPSGNRVRILNRSGLLLLELDDDRDLGIWRVVNEKDRKKSGAPSFCRSGEGHPVWGRQWCVDKGFGLGSSGDFRWGRAVGFNDVVFRRPAVTTGDLTRDVLYGVLGDVVFNRLAAHAITLGLTEPLVGRWLGEPSGPQVLLLSSGGRPVAEVVDVNRDDRADMLIVALRP